MTDLNGKTLQIGDEVDVPCIVTKVTDPNTIDVKLKYPVPVDQSGVFTVLNLNSVQVVKTK